MKCVLDDLLLIAFSSKNVTLQEARLKSAEIIRCMELLHQTVSVAIASARNDVELTEQSNRWHGIFEINSILYSKSASFGSNLIFEKALPECHYIPLPKEAQLRIDDALSEMEAMDYREWNDEPLKSHREFYIIGSALYFKSYLLASHLPPADVVDVETYLRVFGIFNFIEKQSIRDLVIWQEIYPKSVERGLVFKDCTYG